MGTYIEDHGGECCGRKHLYYLGDVGPIDDVVNQCVKELDKYCGENGDEIDVYNRDHCVEVTLTYRQAKFKATSGKYKDKNWDEVLQQVFGFRRVYAFNNPNTGNDVYVYLFSENEEPNEL